jgi:transposase-like protein
MRKPKLKQITAALRQLTPVERKAVVAELAALDAGTAAVTVIEGRFAAGTVCPHCKAEAQVARSRDRLIE